MKLLLPSLLSTVGLAAWLAPVRGLAQPWGGEDECPDEKSTPVEATSVPVGPFVECTLVYPAPYTGISIDGPACPIGRIRYPAHSVCAGEPSEGSRCEWLGQLPVWRDACRCKFLQVFELTLPLVTCGCEPAEIVGHVSTAGELLCP